MKITTEVLAELSALVITNNCASIVKQLDRKLYVKLDAVLKELGGKWDRKAQAHVFPEDPTARLDLAIVSGELTTAADLGFFPTPPELARQLVAMADVQPGHVVLEPSAGEGAIAVEVMRASAMVYCVERDPNRRKALSDRLGAVFNARRRDPIVGNFTIRVEQSDPEGLSDFLDYEPEEPFDRVVMNPPFIKVGKGDHLDHFYRALECVAPGGTVVSVMPAGVLFREDKRHTTFRSRMTRFGSIEPLPDDSFKESGTRVRTCVVKVTR